MSPDEASTLTLLAEVPDAFEDIRDELLESLSGPALEIGQVLITPPAERDKFSQTSRQAAEQFEHWLTPEIELEGPA